MDTVFPDIPLYQGWGAPLRLESDIRDIRLVHGRVPRDLTGVLYRCGPDRQYPSMTKEDVFIDGEGMAHLFRFENGHVDYRSRWVRTERFRLQERARRSLFGRYRNRYTNDPSVAVVKAGAPEGEGYLLVIVNRLAENHSDLAILNASDIAAGPIALLTLPVRVRATFHGMWVCENTLTTGRYVT